MHKRCCNYRTLTDNFDLQHRIPERLELFLGLFGVRVATIFNLLLENIRSMNSVYNHLDVFLSGVPYQPTVTGMGRAVLTNSLLDQLPAFYTQTMKSDIILVDS